MGGGYERGGGKKGGKRARGGHAIECLNGWGHEGRARGPLGLARWVVGYVIGFCGAVISRTGSECRQCDGARGRSLSPIHSRGVAPRRSRWLRGPVVDPDGDQDGRIWAMGCGQSGSAARTITPLCPDVFRRRLTGNCVCLVCVPARPGVFEHARAASAHARERASERMPGTRYLC